MSSIMRQTVDHVNQMASAAAAGSPVSTAPTQDVLEALHALVHLARARRYRDAALPAAAAGSPPLTPLEGRVLGFFARQPGATQRDLAEHSGRDKGQLARLVQGLREQGLLVATPDAADRRVTRLHLSASAQAQHHALHAQGQRLSAAAVADLSTAEQQTLLALLARVRNNLERAG
jgi:DNA-binding MarR family transcriptional regulator